MIAKFYEGAEEMAVRMLTKKLVKAADKGVKVWRKYFICVLSLNSVYLTSSRNTLSKHFALSLTYIFGSLSMELYFNYTDSQ